MCGANCLQDREVGRWKKMVVVCLSLDEVVVAFSSQLPWFRIHIQYMTKIRWSGKWENKECSAQSMTIRDMSVSSHGPEG